MAAQKVVVITGANSGIGLATALAFASTGWKTYAALRDLSKGAQLLQEAEKLKAKDNLELVVMSVDHQDSAQKAISHVLEKSGHIDALVNNAGHGIDGAFEDYSDEDVAKVFNTNVFGIVRTMQAVLPAMRAARSVLGVYAWPFSSLYCSTKFAVEGLSMSVAQEVSPFGIRVVVVEPGITKSAFATNIVKASKPQPAEIYAEGKKNALSHILAALPRAAEAEHVAAVVLKAASDVGSDQFRYPVGEREEKALGAVLRNTHALPPASY